MALGAETQGEARLLSARAGGSVPGCPIPEGGELGEDLEEVKNKKEKQEGTTCLE